MSGPLIESFDVATTLLAQRIVSGVTGTGGACQYPTTNTALYLGVTVDTVIDTNGAIPVQLNGKAWVFFNDTVAAGELVGSDTSGRGVPFTLGQTSTSISSPASYLGILVGPSVAVTGTVAQVLINPGFDRNAR